MAADIPMTCTVASEAELRRRIEEDPDDAAALDSLGLFLRDAGKANAALDCFKKAVMAKPDHVEAQLHMAEILLDLDQFTAAVMAYRRLTILIPDSAPLYTALGVALKRGGDLAAAMACYRKAMALDPEDTKPVFNLALILEEAANSEAALAAYETITSIAPEMFEAWVNLGNLHHRENRFTAAAKAYERALSVNPEDASTWSRLGVVADALGAQDEARAHYRTALELDPKCVEAHYNMGISLREQGDLAAAIDSYRAAVSVDADQVADQDNYGTALLAQGQLDDTVDAYRQATGGDPVNAVHANSAWNLSLALLLSGNYEEGWRWYEWRFHKGSATPPSFEKPRWYLDAPVDARVLVWAEQGYGDTMQFVRYVPMVKARAGTVILEIHPNLRCLLDGFGGAVTVVSGEAVPEHDFHIPMLSLPGLFGTTVDSVPANIPYLSGDPERVTYWRERLAGDGRTIGLSWRGNPENQNDRHRSVDPTLLGPLLHAPGCRFFSLQKIPAAGDWDVLANVGPITDLGPELDDFFETAAVIEALDLVITVDTATAHLAGGLGKSSWLMLPFIPDWRWMLDAEESLWYPSLRLFRQTEMDSWPTVIERMTVALHDEA